MQKWMLLLATLGTIWLSAGCSVNSTPEKAPFSEQDAIRLVLQDHPEFPAHAGDVKKISGIGGGPAPGTTYDGTLKTDVHKEGDMYRVILTKEYNVIVNGTPAKSVWEYEVTATRKSLVKDVENADLINIIK